MTPQGRRGARRRSRSEWTSGPALAGIALGVLAVVGILAMWVLQPDPVARDPETMCPDDGPSKVTAILIDTTDRVGPVSRTHVLGRLDDLVASSRPDEMMIAYETSPIDPDRNDDPLPSLLTVCNPGDPDEANPLISNPERIRRRLQDNYEQPLEERFQQLLNRAPAPASPLMENVQAIAVTVLSRRRHQDVPKRLVVVSDLAQHSEQLSFFDDPLDYEAFVGTAGARALRTNLRGVDVEILFIQRDEHDRIGGERRLIEFWERWIADQNGRLAGVRKIDGLN